MKLGFWFDYDQTYTFCALYAALQKRIPDLTASGFVVNDRYWSHAVENLPKESHLLRFYDLVAQARAHKPTEAELVEFEALDERYRLARISYTDRHLQTYKHDELVPLYIGLIAIFRRYIEEVKPDFFIFNCVASHFAHLFYVVLLEAKVKVIIPFHFGVEDFNYLSDNPYLECHDIWQTYASYRSGALPIPGEAVTWAEKFMAHVRAERAAYTTHAYSLEQERFSFPGPRRAVQYLYNYFAFYRNDPHQPSIVRKVWSVPYLRYNRSRTVAYFKPLESLQGRKFIYFPLHYEPEIATLVFSQYEHASVIDIVARQLPIGWTLAVKEHPMMVGQRPHRFFAEMAKRYPNISFIDPGVNSQLLAKQAEAVLTLSGTVVLEALILGTPPIFTSMSRFGGFGLGTFTHNLIDFGKAIEHARTASVSQDELVALLASIWKHCHRFDLSEPAGRPSVLSDDNIEKVAAAVLDHVARHA